MPPRPASSHDTATWFEQKGFGIRFGWGPNDLRRLAPGADVVVIVDVLSFSTAVDVALGRGAVVLPYARHDGSEHEFAEANDAVLASPRRTDAAPSAADGADVIGSDPGDRRSVPEPADGVDDPASAWSLSPVSLTTIDAGTRLVLPSPNGSALAFGAKDAGAEQVLVACLRNASAIARACVDADVVAVIAAGERWRGATGPLRPAVEDLLGAGAVIDAIAARHFGLGTDGRSAGAGPQTAGGDPSPEARAAAAAFRDARADVALRLAECGSGRELIDRGFGADVDLAAALDVSTVVATLCGVELRDDSSADTVTAPAP